MNRLRGLLSPSLVLFAGGALVAMNHLGRLRSGKAEGAGWLFLLVGAAMLVAALYRVVKPLPIAVGVGVVVMVNGQPSAGIVTALQGDACTVATGSGTHLLDRYAILSLMKPSQRATR